MREVDLSPEAVEARLRQVSRLREDRRRPDVDMSAEAIEQRLKKVSELRELCRRLASFEISTG